MSSHQTSFGELLAMPADELRKDILTQRMLVRKMRLGIHLNKEKDAAKYRREKRALARMLTAQGSAPLTPTPVKKAATKSAKTIVKGLKPKAKSRSIPAPRSSKSEVGAAPKAS